MSRITIIVCLFVLVAAACGRKDGDRADDTTAEPAIELSPIEALCAGIDYADTAALHNEAAMGKRMAAIVRLMPESDTLATDRALTTFLNAIKADPVALKVANHYLNQYLGSPASPVRNEELYIRYLNSLLSVDSLPDAMRDRADDRLRAAMLNRPGSVANDFGFVDRDGLRRTLHSLPGEQIMLIFYDPECPHCPEILDQIAANGRINAAIDQGQLTVAAIYTEGKRDVWDHTSHELPARWLVGYDLSGIVDNELYDLPAMPIIYLLDSSKHVLLKDPDYRRL